MWFQHPKMIHCIPNGFDQHTPLAPAMCWNSSWFTSLPTPAITILLHFCPHTNMLCHYGLYWHFLKLLLTLHFSTIWAKKKTLPLLRCLELTFCCSQVKGSPGSSNKNISVPSSQTVCPCIFQICWSCHSGVFWRFQKPLNTKGGDTEPTCHSLTLKLSCS